MNIYFCDVHKMQHFQFYPDIRVKHLGGGTTFLGCSFFLIFVPNTWEVETYFWEMCTTQCFLFYPDIRANHLGGKGVAIYLIIGMCIKPIAKIEWSM